MTIFHEYETVVADLEEPGLYTVAIFDEVDNCVGQVFDVPAWSHREAYYSVMNEVIEHCTWNAWRTMNLEQWPDRDPQGGKRPEYAAKL